MIQPNRLKPTNRVSPLVSLSVAADLDDCVHGVHRAAARGRAEKVAPLPVLHIVLSGQHSLIWNSDLNHLRVLWFIVV